ncbi:OmpA/MotB domain protein [Desulfosarcina variabilis str. Montpellier]|jgi:chemotaxis protein MotB|uniref:OmpA family protein n=1 Tax=Desulfosarcina variabilis TaxID=2300 RepID=UPI003AFA09F9
MQASRPSIAWRIHRISGCTKEARFQTACGQKSGENDAFLWSLADLMTLLLVFFIMLYSNAVSQLLDGPVHAAEQEKPGTTMSHDSLVGVFSERSKEMPVLDIEAGEPGNKQPEMSVEKAPVAMQPDVLQTDEGVNHRMLANLEDGFSNDFYVRWDDRQPVIVLGERITFNAGEAILLVDAHDALRRVAQLISELDNCQVVVTGHTDNCPIHTSAFPSNWELSAARAASVAKALVQSGVSPGQLVIQGQSQFNPLVPNTNQENRRRNRRVEISLISK